jgi:uncharacterized protein YjbI with pentapeptide repeats
VRLRAARLQAVRLRAARLQAARLQAVRLQAVRLRAVRLQVVRLREGQPGPLLATWRQRERLDLFRRQEPAPVAAQAFS